VKREGRDSMRTRWESYITANLRAGWLRVRGALIPNVQSAVFATLAWLLCYYLLRDPAPIFAPIAAYLCLGFSRNREPRKVVEIGIGASTGVLIGDLFAHWLGFGGWQVLVLLLVTPLIGRMIDRSDLVTFQTGINALVVASMVSMPTAGGSGVPGPFDRWISALVGAAVALIATAFLPVNVVTRPKRFTAFAISETSAILHRLSKGLLDGDAQAIAQLRGRLAVLREVVNDGRRALTSAQETATINPGARGSRDVLAELDRMLGLVERLHITVSMMQRQARGMVAETGPMPGLAGPVWQVADLLEQVSQGVSAWKRPTRARDAAAALAASLAPLEIATHQDWRMHTLTSLLRAVVVDLLQLTGLSMAQARAVLADTGAFDPASEHGAATTEQASVLWGTEQLPAVSDDEDPSGVAGERPPDAAP